MPGHKSNEHALNSYSKFTVNQTTPIMRKCSYTGSGYVKSEEAGISGGLK